MKYFIFVLLFLFTFAANIKAEIWHEVKKGDTLFNISKRYQVPLWKVKEANHLKGSKVKIGENLLIPKEEAKPSPYPEKEETVPEKKPPPKVKTGENLLILKEVPKEEAKPSPYPEKEKIDLSEEKLLPKELIAVKKRVSLDFKDAEIGNVLRVIAEIGHLNIITSKEVAGKVTLKLVDVPLEQILDVILKTNNLGMERIGPVVRIVTLEELKKLEELEPLETRSLLVENADVKDLLAEPKIQTLLSKRGNISFDPRTNKLIITDVKKRVEEIVSLIVTELDTPTYQVSIEARIVQASTDFSRELGIQWGGKFVSRDKDFTVTGGGVGATTGTQPTTPQTGGVGLSGENLTVNLPAAVGPGAGGSIGFIFGEIGRDVIDLQLSALESEGKLKIISSPKVVTLDGKEAVIKQGTRIPYETVSEKGTQTEWVDAVLELTVTPYITPDKKRVRMKIKATKNSPSTLSVKGVPAVDTRETTTEVVVGDGKTIVIGGIYETTQTTAVSKVPLLSRIPLLGLLFKRSTKIEKKTELLIFLTPGVLKKT